MDFSESFRYSGPSPLYSPNGLYVACAQDRRVVVRDVVNLQMIRIVSCLDKVQKLEWALNSKLLLCSLSNRAQVFSIEDHEWSFKIDEGSAGVRSCMWAPDCRSVLVIADFQIRISVYSLVDESVKLMRGPKYADKGIAFSPDGQLLAYAERTDCKEYVSLVDTTSWDLCMRVATTTQDLADLAWSPTSDCFVVWDVLLTYKLLIYSSHGHCLASYSAYQDALGIRTVQWSPDGHFLAVGSYDQEMRILASNSWRPIARLDHTASLRDDENLVAYSEVSESGSSPPATTSSRSRYVVLDGAVRVEPIKAPAKNPNPKIGVAPPIIASFSTSSQEETNDVFGCTVSVLWSPDGNFIASRNDCMPYAVFIWSVQSLELVSILVQAAPIRTCQWQPHRALLVISTGCNKLYLWHPGGASCVHIPVQAFNVQLAQCSPLGNSLLLTDRDQYCCVYMEDGDA